MVFLNGSLMWQVLLSSHWESEMIIDESKTEDAGSGGVAGGKAKAVLKREGRKKSLKK